MTKTYVTEVSPNYSEREKQVGDYHPDLCYQLGKIHVAYGWTSVPRGEWDDAQKEAFLKAWQDVKETSDVSLKDKP